MRKSGFGSLSPALAANPGAMPRVPARAGEAVARLVTRNGEPA